MSRRPCPREGMAWERCVLQVDEFRNRNGDGLGSGQRDARVRVVRGDGIGGKGLRFRHVFIRAQQFEVAVGRSLVQFRVVGIVPQQDGLDGQDGGQGKNAVLRREGGGRRGGVFSVQVAEGQPGTPLRRYSNMVWRRYFLSTGSMS